MLTDRELRTVRARFRRIVEISGQQYVTGWRSSLLKHLELANNRTLHFFIENEVVNTRRNIQSIQQASQGAVFRLQNQYIIFFVIAVILFILFTTLAVDAGLTSGVLAFEDLNVNDPFTRKLYSVTLFIIANEQISPQNNATILCMLSVLLAVFALIFVLFNMLFFAGTKIVDNFLAPFFMLQERRIDQLNTVLLISKYDQFDASEQKLQLKEIFEGVTDSDRRVETLSEKRKALEKSNEGTSSFKS